MRAFRVFGIDVYIDYSWLLIFALILWSFTFSYFPSQYPGRDFIVYLIVGLASTLLFFGSVLFHELSHSLVANSHGVKVERITLFIFGGVSHLTTESPDPAVEVRIAAAGPAASFVLGLLFLGVSWLSPSGEANIWAGMSAYLGALNLALGIFNLLPGFPLDGGRVLRAILWGRSGDRLRATNTAAGWGKGLGWVLIALGALLAFNGSFFQGIWLVFIGLFLKEAAFAERRSVLLGSTLGGLSVGQLMTPSPVTIPRGTSVQEALHAFFLRHGYGGYPVVDDDRVVGLVSLADLAKCAPDDRDSTTVASIMTPLAPDTMSWPGEDVTAAMRKMSAAGISRIPVLEASGYGRLVGLLTYHAVMRQIKLREMAAGSQR